TVIALLSKNHLKNQDRLKCFSFCSINTSFLLSSHYTIFETK
ncbi:hypothetical protein PNI0076_01442, partial [Streptococcus pneumoniae PNI0076]